MMNPDRIKEILVVGGGSAGWMTALHLVRLLKGTDCRITLVESARIGGIGVGEATIPSMTRYIRRLGLDEAELMRACGGSYKLGIEFHDWRGPGTDYFHAFGLCGGRVDGFDLFHFWLADRLKRANPKRYQEYSLQARAAARGLGPRSATKGSPITEAGAYAFHLDAAAMADHLRDLAVADGVTHLFDEVEDVAVGDDGFVRSVHTVGGRTLSADLFIDCTGFAGRLIETALGDPWIDFGDRLLCDRAVALPRPRDEEMTPYTRCTAQAAGWIWEIPLSHRMGSGYVYSHAHLADDAAAEALIARAGFRRTRSADPRFLRMRVGRRTEFWRGNVMAIGLSSGFIEPLESTGLYFVHLALELLSEFFPDRRCDAGLRLQVNRRMAEAYDEVRDFVLLHYLLADRPGEPFWEDARAVALTGSLAETLAAYDDNGGLARLMSYVFAAPSWYFVLSGNGRLPRRPCLQADKVDPAAVSSILGNIERQNEAFLEELPGHAALMRWVHQRPVEGEWPAASAVPV